MIRRSLGIAAFLAAPLWLAGADAVRFADHFRDRTMRIDYYHAGNAREETITLDQVYDQGIWAGSRTNLVDPFNIGRYSVKILDAAAGTLLFSRGFDSYFGEYKTSDAALQGVMRTYHESALFPYPKSKVLFLVEARGRDNTSQTLFSREIDPSSTSIIREAPIPGVKKIELARGGDPHGSVDIAFIPEGYTAAEEAKLRSDLDRFVGVFLGFEPYKSRREKFNFVAAWKPSLESGCDEPSHGVFKTTSLNAAFDALGSERYLLTEDNRSLRDIAAHVPYDVLLIMVNHERYGGGGIYNFTCTFTTDNQWFEYLVLHEFGHSFAGLADEYYTSQIAYNEFYPPGVEPVERNITALLDPANLKWKGLASPGIAIPTPWEKEAFDAMDTAYQKIRGEVNAKIARLKREGAGRAETAKVEEESERLSREHARKVDDFLMASKFWGLTGAFEGAGYAARGLYRPAVDCLMFTKGRKPFCRVCERAVIDVIAFYGE